MAAQSLEEQQHWGMLEQHQILHEAKLPNLLERQILHEARLQSLLERQILHEARFQEQFHALLEQGTWSGHESLLQEFPTLLFPTALAKI